jgi:hypothetical protein
MDRAKEKPTSFCAGGSSVVTPCRSVPSNGQIDGSNGHHVQSNGQRMKKHSLEGVPFCLRSARQTMRLFWPTRPPESALVVYHSHEKRPPERIWRPLCIHGPSKCFKLFQKHKDIYPNLLDIGERHCHFLTERNSIYRICHWEVKK